LTWPGGEARKLVGVTAATGPSTGDVVVALVVAEAFTTTVVVVAATAFVVVVVVVVVTFDNKLRLILSTSQAPVTQRLHSSVCPGDNSLCKLEAICPTARSAKRLLAIVILSVRPSVCPSWCHDSVPIQSQVR